MSRDWGEPSDRRMTSREEREARLAAQLRANLKRRKAQAREAVTSPFRAELGEATSLNDQEKNGPSTG